jgi:MFS family permease
MSLPTSEPSTSTPPPRHDPYAALREPSYRFFAGGWLVASLGLQMQGTALLWEVWDRTRDPMSLGWASLARALPVLALALPAGQIVDRLDRKNILFATQIAFAIASLLLAWGSHAHAPMLVIYGLIALTGCARVFNGPSRSSLLPQIVPPSRFHNAVTWNSGVFQCSAAIGPIVAGLLIAGCEAAWPVYVLTAMSCAWFAIMLTQVECVHEDGAPRSGGRLSQADLDEPNGRLVRVWEAVRPSTLLPGILEGARFVFREKAILGAISLDMFGVLLGGATALLPIFATDILRVGPVELGALKAAPYVGAFVMAFVLAHRPPIRRNGRAMLWSVIAFGACTIGFGLSTSFALSLCLLMALGAVDNISVVIRHVLVTVRTPPHLRGRVSAVNTVFIESSNELGGLESAAVADVSTRWLGTAGGAVFSAVSGGIGTIMVVALIAWRLPEFAKLGAIDPGEPPPPTTGAATTAASG